MPNNVSRNDVRRDLAKTFRACNIRVQALDMDLSSDLEHVRIWKRAQSLGKKPRDFCICSHLDLRRVGGQGGDARWEITAIYDAPNVTDNGCTRKSELCF